MEKVCWGILVYVGILFFFSSKSRYILTFSVVSREPGMFSERFLLFYVSNCYRAHRNVWLEVNGRAFNQVRSIQFLYGQCTFYMMVAGNSSGWS